MSHITLKLTLCIICITSFILLNNISHAIESDLQIALVLAESGDADAQRKVADNFYDKKQYKEAFGWYNKLAENGDAFSINRLGNMYHEGWGVKKNLKEARRLYKIAADLGNKFAQYNLGNSYYHGEGGEKDLDSAFYWLDLSCKQGHKKACGDIEYIAQKINKNPRRKQENFDNGQYELYCTYHKDSSTGKIIGIVGGAAAAFMTGTKSVVTDIASDLLSDTVTHKIQCNASHPVNYYSAHYFFSNGNNKFRESENYEVKDSKSTKILTLDKNSLTSTLDFIGVTIPVRSNTSTEEITFFFRVDPKRETIEGIDGQRFINNVSGQYLPK